MIRPDGYGHVAHCSIRSRVNIQGAIHQPCDKSSKWLIQHHGDSMLRLARVKNIRARRPAPGVQGCQMVFRLGETTQPCFHPAAEYLVLP
jgi:hypothetical protein